MDKIENFGIACMIITVIVLVLLFALVAYEESTEPELYSAYADSSIFKDGKISMSYVKTGCLTFEEEPVRRCRADLVFNDRAVGFVNFKELKQDNTKQSDRNG